MRCLAFAGALLCVGGVSATAQDLVQLCAIPDSIDVRGNSRVSAASIRSDASLAPREASDVPGRQRAIRNLFQTGQFNNIRLDCEISETPRRATLVITVIERPLLGDLRVEGTDAISARMVRDRIELLAGRPLDPSAVTRAVTRIDSLYESRGYYLVRVQPETTTVADRTVLTFKIDEGRRLAVSGIRIVGNKNVSAEDIVGAMTTSPEGFWWWARGEFDEDAYALDLSSRIPEMYAARGYLDAEVVRDSLVVDREAGKALVELTVFEGAQYRIGTFEIVGNRHFSTDELMRHYPFGESTKTVGQRLAGLVGREDKTPEGVFNLGRWDAAVSAVNDAYNDEGFIRAVVSPIMERGIGKDSVPLVNLRWDITEGPLAIVRRIDIRGNDYTSEHCIRERVSILPGSVYSRQRLIQSYQAVGSLGFFQMPLPNPDVNPVGDQGEIDIVLSVIEKQTGNVNFGANVGQGTGVGGFIGLDQPNLFGQCKRGSLQWQFGQLINDFNLSYTDPSIQKSTLNGRVDVYHTRSRYVVRDFGRQIRTGGSLRFGLPILGSSYSRLYLSYGGERVKYGRDPNSLLGQLATECDNCFRSTLGVVLTKDTRLGLPFAFNGAQQSFDAQFNGGPLGGTAQFQRYTVEQRFYTPLASLREDGGGEPMVVVFGMTGRAGMVFGNTGPFFPFQEFALGGTQQGESLRGYDEFSITPGGYVGGVGTVQASRSSFGRAFFTSTVELGLRLSSSVYLSSFFDAGNVWSHPREFSPARLFRGAGVGIGLVTPLGPLGLDWAYGFDRINAAGRPDPGWKLHFKLGQLF